MKKLKNMEKVIRFTAAWCGPCKTYAKTFESVKNEINDVEWETVDISLGSKLVEEYGIKSIPATIMLKEDGTQKKHIGAMSETELRKFILE